MKEQNYEKTEKVSSVFKESFRFLWIMGSVKGQGPETEKGRNEYDCLKPLKRNMAER